MVAGVYGDAIKLKLTAPPVDGAANSMCIQFLSKRLKVSKSSLEIVAGQTSRTKKLLLKYKNPDANPMETEQLKRSIYSLVKPKK
jgi:uncharacterized protein (TIGR00251 family)